MRTIIIGASHSGIQAARTLKKLQPEMDVVLLEKTQTIGFFSSGLNYMLTNKIQDLQESRAISPQALLDEGINLVRLAEVTKIDPVKKGVFFTYGKEVAEHVAYDFLILAMGSTQAALKTPGSDFGNILSYKNITQTQKSLAILKQSHEVTIVGTGYIGMELAYALSKQNKKVHLIEQMENILFRYFDSEMVTSVLADLPSNIQLHLNTTPLSFTGVNGKVEETNLSNGATIQNDAVVLAINARPNTSLVQEFLTLNIDGTVAVNEFLQTNYADIYAIGDLIQVPIHGTNTAIYMPLVNHAIRTGIVAAENIVYQNTIKLKPTKKTSVTQLGSFYLSRTGITQEEAPYYNKKVVAVTQQFEDYGFEQNFSQRPLLKLIFEEKELKLIGAQYISKFPRLEFINLLAEFIEKDETALTLSQMEAFFNPLFSAPLHYVQQLALQILAENN